jgi:hypothetical protein
MEINKNWNTSLKFRRLQIEYLGCDLHDSSRKIEKICGFKEEDLWITEQQNVVYGSDDTITRKNIYGREITIHKKNMNILYQLFDKVEDGVDKVEDEVEDEVEVNKKENLFDNVIDDTYSFKHVFNRKESNKTTNCTKYNKTKKGKRELKRKGKNDKWKDMREKEIKKTVEIKKQRKYKKMHKTVEFVDTYSHDVNIVKNATHALMDTDAYNIFMLHQHDHYKVDDYYDYDYNDDDFYYDDFYYDY